MENITVTLSRLSNFSEYFPRRLLTVPMRLPSRRTEANSMGLPFSSVTVPPIFTFCCTGWARRTGKKTDANMNMSRCFMCRITGKNRKKYIELLFPPFSYVLPYFAGDSELVDARSEMWIKTTEVWNKATFSCLCRFSSLFFIILCISSVCLFA